MNTSFSYKIFLLIAAVLIFFTQTDAQENQRTDEKTKADLFHEVGLTNIGEIEALIDIYLISLYKNPKAQGQIVNYGSEREILRLETFMMNYIRFRRFDTGRITPVRGGYLKEGKTEFWIIPAGAEPPEIEPKPHKIAEFGKVRKVEVSSQMRKFFERLRAEPAATGYIIIDGSETEAARFEKNIRESIRFRTFDATRLTFVRGDPSKPLKTTLWLIPAGLSLDDLDLS